MTTISVHDTNDTLSFETWLSGVSQLCQRRVGVALSDLPDLNTRDAFDAGNSIKNFFESEVAELLAEEFGFEL